MYCNYVCVEAVILLLLSHVGWNDRKNMLLQCSRDKSRIVKNIIYKKFVPILDRYRVSMPVECPFHPQRDFLWWPESDVESDDDDEELTQWSCPFCGLPFLCAETLSIHWDETHRIEMNHPEDSVCLADYCDIMRCDVIVGKRRKRSKNMKSKGAERSETLAKDDRYCNASKMKSLQERCNYVIRQCTIGLLTAVSFKDFQDIEEGLMASICSYLTCDKFYDDYTKETKIVPLTLCVIIGIIMIGGFCLCYYIVWMLFDAGLNSREAILHHKEIKDGHRLANSGEESRPLTHSERQAYSDRIPKSERPKILVTSPSSQRFRAQPLHYYHQNRHHYTDDDWESCVENMGTRTTVSTSMSTTAAIHSSTSRASSNTDKSSVSTPHR